MPLEERKQWIIFITSQNIQISPLTKQSWYLRSTSYLFPFISACREGKKQISQEVILVSMWTKTDFGGIFKIIQICKRYDSPNKMQIGQHWVIAQTVPYSEQQVVWRNDRTWKMAKWDFAWITDVRKEMEDSRLNAIRQLITFVKSRLNFNSKTTTAANVQLTESHLDNCLKNYNNIAINIIYYLRNHLVSFFFLRILVFKIYSISTAKKTEKNIICGNVLKLDLSELANQMRALVVQWDLWLTGWTPQPRYIGSLCV